MTLVGAVTDRAAEFVEQRTSRRGFVGRSAMVGSALMVGGSTFVLRPGTAYAAICSCPPSATAVRRDCDCNDLCCGGYTEFCCHVYGENACPPDTLLAGWWKVDNSTFCDGAARYYLDCNKARPACSCGSSGVCKGSDTTCQCRTCDSRRDGCTAFRYGNCNNNVACVGPIMCRVVTCSKPWELDPGCSTVARTDPATAWHHRACLEQPVEPEPEPVVVTAESRAWTKAIYFDYIGRQPSAGEEEALATEMSRGLDRVGLSVAFSRSDVYLSTVIEDLHRDILGRPAGDSAITFWTTRLQAGATVTSVAAALYGSDEYFDRFDSVEAFVTSLYEDILDRPPAESGLAYWSGIASVAAQRPRVGAFFFDSIESRRKRVLGLYLRFLNRLPGPSGLEHWAQVLTSGNDLKLATFLSGSREYLNRAQDRFS